MKVVYFENDEVYKRILNENIKTIDSIVSFKVEMVLATSEVQEVTNYAKQSLKEKEEVNVYLIEAYINGKLDGIELAKTIRKIDVNAYIVFLSNKDLSMLACNYKIKAYDYLAKPVFMEDIMALIVGINKDHERINTIINEEDLETISITTGYRQKRIPICDIVYIESNRPKIVIHTDDNVVTSYESLNDVYKKITKVAKRYVFFRAHSGYIVNLSKALYVDYQKRYLMLNNDVVIPISRGKIKEAKEMAIRKEIVEETDLIRRISLPAYY